MNRYAVVILVALLARYGLELAADSLLLISGARRASSAPLPPPDEGTSAGAPKLRPAILLALLTLSLGTIGPTTAHTHPTPRDGIYRQQSRHERPHPGALPVTRQGSAAGHVVPGAVVRPTRALLFSEDNGNTRFQVFLEFGHTPGCNEGVIVLGGAAVWSGGYGSSNDRCTLSFELDAAQATLAAAALRISRQDRHPAGEQVQGNFAPSQPSYGRGQPVEVVLSLVNPEGAPPVQRHQGGRQRGPRDNQFAFQITRDGQPVTPVDGPDFGGLSGPSPMAPGARVELRAPLDRWGDIGQPGHYVVECRYETQFSPEGSRPFDDAQRGAVWDRSFTGRVVFDVR